MGQSASSFKLADGVHVVMTMTVPKELEDRTEKLWATHAAWMKKTHVKAGPKRCLSARCLGFRDVPATAQEACAGHGCLCARIRLLKGLSSSNASISCRFSHRGRILRRRLLQCTR